MYPHIECPEEAFNDKKHLCLMHVKQHSAVRGYNHFQEFYLPSYM